MQYMTALAVVPLLAGCVVGFETGNDSCGSSAYVGLIGQNAAGLEISASADTRVIRPGTVVTMDYNPERLNIRLDSRGVVTGVDCG